MANIMYQRLEIAGSPDDLKRVEASMEGEDRKVSLNAVRPVPNDLWEACHKHNQLASIISWRAENWGVTSETQDPDAEWQEISKEESWISMEYVQEKLYSVPSEKLERFQRIRFSTNWDPIELVVATLSERFPEVLFCLCAVEENCGSGSVGIWFDKTLLATDQIPCLNQENWLHAKLIAHVYPEN